MDICKCHIIETLDRMFDNTDVNIPKDAIVERYSEYLDGSAASETIGQTGVAVTALTHVYFGTLVYKLLVSETNQHTLKANFQGASTIKTFDLDGEANTGYAGVKHLSFKHENCPFTYLVLASAGVQDESSVFFDGWRIALRK